MIIDFFFASGSASWFWFVFINYFLTYTRGEEKNYDGKSA
jgi:hypothetical protein